MTKVTENQRNLAVINIQYKARGELLRGEQKEQAN